MRPNLKLAKQLNRGATIISIVVFVLVGMMRQYKVSVDMDTSWMPAFHALANSIVALSLSVAYIAIKKNNVLRHKRAIYVAMFFSFLFLLSYVIYHFTTEEVRFCREGLIRTFYFILLISHIVLAGISLPFILFTFVKGYTGQYVAHRKMAKWVFPVWLYVAITGPLSYVLLMPCY